MKQLLSLFLFLLPCLALAQYPNNGNQKITLGEQSTADGLIWRGVAADTTLTAKSDTAAYFVLDTVNINLYTYKASATGRKWRQLGADTASIAYVNTYGTQTVNGAKTFTTAPTFSNALGLASGGTGGTSYANGNVIYSNGTALTSDTSLFWNSTNKILSIGKKTLLNTNIDLQVGGKGNRARVYIIAPNANDYTQMLFGHGESNGQYAEFFRNNTNKEFSINNVDGDFFVSTKLVSSTFRNDFFLESDNGRIGLGTNAPSEALHVVGNARITAMNGINDIGASATGVLQAATSDMNLKNTIENSPFGLNEILLLNPVTFLYNDTDRKIDSDVKEVGFIAQDVFDVIPNAVSSTGTSDLQLDYRAITATLVKAIQEQQALIKALEQRIINLENK
jgi:hypothetical protein